MELFVYIYLPISFKNCKSKDVVSCIGRPTCVPFHTLCHAVTLTFDLLTLNFYSTSFVLCLISVQNLSEIHSYWRFSTFARAMLGGGAELTELFQGCVAVASSKAAGEAPGFHGGPDEDRKPKARESRRRRRRGQWDGLWGGGAPSPTD